MSGNQQLELCHGCSTNGMLIQSLLHRLEKWFLEASLSFATRVVQHFSVLPERLRRRFSMETGLLEKSQQFALLVTNLLFTLTGTRNSIMQTIAIDTITQAAIDRKDGGKAPLLFLTKNALLTMTSNSLNWLRCATDLIYRSAWCCLNFLTTPRFSASA